MYRLFYSLYYGKYTKLTTMHTTIQRTKRNCKIKNVRPTGEHHNRRLKVVHKNNKRNISRKTDTNSFSTIRFSSITTFKEELCNSDLFETDEDIMNCCNQLFQQRKKLFYPYRQDLANNNCIDCLDKMLQLIVEQYNKYDFVELHKNDDNKYFVQVTFQIPLEGMYFIAMDWLLSLIEEGSKELKGLLYFVMKKFDNVGVANPFMHPYIEYEEERLYSEISHLEQLSKENKKKKLSYKEELDEYKNTLDWIKDGRFAKEMKIYKSVNGSFDAFYKKIIPQSTEEERLLEWLVECNKVLNEISDLQAMTYFSPEIDEYGYMMASEFIRFIWTKNEQEFLGEELQSIDNDAMNMGVGGFYFSCIMSDKTPYPIVNNDYLKYYKLMSFQDEYKQRKSP